MLADKLRMASATNNNTFFVSSSSGRSADGENPTTVPVPTGVQDGDLLIAICFADGGNANKWRPATGWTLVFNQRTSANACALMVKTASSESGNYSFTNTGTSRNRVTVLAYRNATRINTYSSVNRITSNTVLAPSIIPTYEGFLCTAFFTETTANVSTPPAGMTLRYSNSADAPAMAVYDVEQSATESGDKTIVWSASSDAAAFSFQITNESTVAPEFIASAQTQRSTSGTALAISKPAGTAEGDLMVAVMAIPTNATWTGATGWTEVADEGSSPGLRVAYRVAGASEGSSYTFTSSASGTSSGCIITYRYADFDTIGSISEGALPRFPSGVTASESQSLLIAAGATSSASVTITAESIQGVSVMSAVVTDNNATAPSYRVFSEVIPKCDPGSREIGGSGLTSSAVLLVIKPTRSL
jgi:hypothetical protein